MRATRATTVHCCPHCVCKVAAPAGRHRVAQIRSCAHNHGVSKKPSVRERMLHDKPPRDRDIKTVPGTLSCNMARPTPPSVSRPEKQRETIRVLARTRIFVASGRRDDVELRQYCPSQRRTRRRDAGVAHEASPERFRARDDLGARLHLSGHCEAAAGCQMGHFVRCAAKHQSLEITEATAADHDQINLFGFRQIQDHPCRVAGANA